MTTHRHSSQHRAHRRHRRRIDRYYRAPNPRLELAKKVALTVLIVGSIAFLTWAFLFYR